MVGGSSAALATFNLSTGVVTDIAPIENANARHVGVVEGTKHVFYTKQHDIGAYYQCSQTALVDHDIEPPSQLSWLSGLTFDRVADRFIITTYGGAGDIASYDPGTDGWQLMASLNNFDGSGVVHHQATNKLLLWGNAWQSSMFRYSSQGALEATLTLSPMIVVPFSVSRVQAVSSAGSVFLLLQSNSTSNPQVSIATVDPMTGATNVVF